MVPQMTLDAPYCDKCNYKKETAERKFPKLVQHNSKTEGGIRTYETEEGKRYPSVTSVISKTSNSFAIKAWQDRIGIEQAKKITAEAAKRGNMIHKCAENYLQINEEDEENEDVWHQRSLIRKKVIYANTFKQMSLNQQIAWTAALPKISENISTIYGIESALYSKKIRTAGSTDLVADYEANLSIIDWKSAIAPKDQMYWDKYFIQAGAYSLMWEELFDMEVKQLVVFNFYDTGSYEINIEKDVLYWQKQFCKRRLKFFEIYGV